VILYALAIAFLIGLMRARIWVVPPLVIAAVVIQLGVGAEWNFKSYQPFNNPIFIDLVMKLMLANVVACIVGFSVGRLIAYVMGWLGRNFRTPLD
jgi:hypothetical protein